MEVEMSYNDIPSESISKEVEDIKREGFNTFTPHHINTEEDE